MPTLTELGKILTANRVVSAERWQRAAKLGDDDPARTLDALAADPPDWWTNTGKARPQEVPPGLTDYQRGAIELWFEGTESDLPRQLARNQFILLDKLGEGGQGAVYRARQLSPGRFVAVKTLTQDSENRRERFEQEARAMMKIQHTSVARFYLYERVRDAAGKPTDEYLIAMEFVDGNDLSQMIHVLGSVPWPFVVRWAIQLLEGLAVIHQNGFIHRDVKPANVMVLGPLPEAGVSPNQTRAKLLDFGAVKPADAESHRVGNVRIFVGTREYAAPEQWDEKTVPESDIYALGATLFHALTGQPPYVIEGRDAKKFRKAHTSEPIPNVTDFTPDIPEELNSLIRQMLAKHPGYRGSATELTQAFSELIPLSNQVSAQAAKAKTEKVASATPRGLTEATEPKLKPRSTAKIEPKTPLHDALHPAISVLERIFLPSQLRSPAGHELPLPERLLVLLRQPLLLVVLVVLFVLIVALMWQIL